MRIKPTGPVHVEHGHRESEIRQRLTRTQDRRMFDRRRDNVITSVLEGECSALDGEIVGLAAAAGENDAAGGAVERARNLAARGLHRLVCCVAPAVNTGGITALPAQGVFFDLEPGKYVLLIHYKNKKFSKKIDIKSIDTYNFTVNLGGRV